jgi:hypothetical protein
MRLEAQLSGLACGLALCGLATAAAAEPLDLYFNNVREYHHANGEVHRFFLNRDHTFAMMLNGKVFAAGTWTYEPATDTLCTSITTPNPPPPPPGKKPGDPRCSVAHTDYKPGVSWNETFANGQTERGIFVPRQ